MKIKIELEVIQETGGLNDKLLLENTEAIIKKHFNHSCDVIENKVTYFRNLGNTYGNADLIVTLSKVEIEPTKIFKPTAADGKEITDGCKLSVQNIKEPISVYKKKDGNLYFKPYGNEELVKSYFSKDLILLD